MTAHAVGIKDVGDSDLIADFSIDLVILGTATQLEAHVPAVHARISRNFDTLVLDLLVGTSGIGEIRTDERQDGDLRKSVCAGR